MENFTQVCKVEHKTMFIAALFTTEQMGNNSNVYCLMDKFNISTQRNTIYQQKLSTDTCHNVDEPWKYYVKGKTPSTKKHILYDPFYTKCPK